MRVVHLAAVAAAFVAATGAGAATVFSETFNASTFANVDFLANDTSDRFGTTDYYTIKAANGFTFTGGAYLAVATGTNDGALLLNENGPTFATRSIAGLTAGQTYKVSALVSGDNRPGQAYVLTGAIANGSLVYSGVDGAAGTNPGKTVAFAFTATGPSELLTLGQNSSSAASPIVDNLSIATVPEPASWALLVAGFGLTGIAVRRKAALTA